MPVALSERFETVVAAAGHLLDAPDRAKARFPREAETGVTEELREVLASWRVGPGDLAVTAGARGADIIIAELCLDYGAEVWLLLPLCETEFVARSVRLAGTEWEARFRSLRRRCKTLFQAEELGCASDVESALATNDRWCIDVAHREAGGGRLHVLVVWDGTLGDGKVGTSHFVAEAARVNAEIKVVDPTRFIGARP